ncbi:MAG: hypothetical protein RBT42_13430 [Aquabacterium sp.]|jgi:hypothetical protein|uniref:hypothetical protein n=1 Tax=Aquabacterium sp. TaxID=1872578 RepID=UPI002A368891|nr:hypothetical protein [Aquabacterium sp.]MDX9844742.1 hypothetical protein [Aquabacterium sp.]
MKAPVLLAWGLTWAGCACLYLSSPHQRWRATPWPARPARAAGAALLLLGLLLFGRGMHATAATFSFVTCVMLTCTLLPYLGVLLSLRRAT